MTLLELLHLMRKHLGLMIGLPLAAALAMGLIAWLVLPNTYTANVSMYVLTQTSDQTGSNLSNSGLSNNDLAASQMLASDVATLIKSDRVISDTEKALNMSSLADYSISVESAATTRLLTLSVTGKSAQSVAIIANKLAETTDDVAREVMEVKSINVIDTATEPGSPSGPPRAMYTAVAFLAGIFVAIALIVLMDALNTRVRTPEEIEELLDLPIIGRVPEITN